MTTATISSAIQDLTGDYQLDAAHSRIGFVARHAMVTKVHVSFQEFEGNGHVDAEDPAKSTVEVRIKTGSITTGNEQRDAHLQTNDFLDAPNFPEMVFKSTAVEQVDDERYRVTGDLTIKDVTKPVTVDFEFTGSAKDPYGNLRLGLEGKARINRRDWGVNWNAALETGGFLVSDKIDLEFDVSAIKLTPTA